MNVSAVSVRGYLSLETVMNVSQKVSSAASPGSLSGGCEEFCLLK
jgi:hypothetical protein